jgi:F-type H+-transporting ATPase subunit a
VSTIREHIREISQDNPEHYLAFIGTLFLFIGLSNLLLIIPGYVAPTSSLTTTAALAICVFFAVPLYGISKRGLLGYLKEYFQPTFIFFPFHVMGEFTRTLALAIRLFGNIMSHDKVIGILLAVTPLFFPIVMNALGLLIGMVQAYIFAILAMVYIASATQAHEQETKKEKH